MRGPARPSQPPDPEPSPGGSDTQAVLRRLRRLRGQADGIVRMIEAQRPPLEVLQQLAALNAALREASVDYASTVLREALAGHIDDRGALDDAVAQVRTVLERSARLP
jgi:CsoR family transcriptional regulator, copper-sensing transcriptional repressor